MNHVILFLVAWLLCQCAAKHQPIEFEPYFTLRPQIPLSEELFGEIRELESRVATLTPFEKRKLLTLYETELRHLKAGTPAFDVLKAQMAGLQTELSGQSEDLQKAWDRALEAQKSQREKAGRRVVAFPPLKKAYQDTYTLWNQDKNIEALDRVAGLLQDPSYKEAAPSDWFLIHYLQFRIALDAGDLSVAGAAYARLKELEVCSEQTATAGFLLSLHQFAKGDGEGATQILKNQCDPDQSFSQKQRNAYWFSRFQENKFEKKEEAFGTLLDPTLPGYYSYLAHLRVGRPMNLAALSLGGKSYLQKELTVSKRVHKLLTAAEERLKSGLFKDAEPFLLEASALFRKKPDKEDLPTVLYIAHLLQAAGNHVEAIRLYSATTEKMLEDPTTQQPFDFVGEMFPRPFSFQVEGASEQWGLDPDLIYALMRQESGFNPVAVSSADARGLMQLMPFLAKNLADQWGYTSSYSDRYLLYGDENLKLASFHLHQLRSVAPHIVLIAASYNAGLHRVANWWSRYGHLPIDVFVELIPIVETRNYSKLVVRNFLYYKAIRNKGVVDTTLLPWELPPFILPGSGSKG